MPCIYDKLYNYTSGAGEAHYSCIQYRHIPVHRWYSRVELQAWSLQINKRNVCRSQHWCSICTRKAWRWYRLALQDQRTRNGFQVESRYFAKYFGTLMYVAWSNSSCIVCEALQRAGIPKVYLIDCASYGAWPKLGNFQTEHLERMLTLDVIKTAQPELISLIFFCNEIWWHFKPRCRFTWTECPYCLVLIQLPKMDVFRSHWKCKRIFDAWRKLWVIVNEDQRKRSWPNRHNFTSRTIPFHYELQLGKNALHSPFNELSTYFLHRSFGNLMSSTWNKLLFFQVASWAYRTCWEFFMLVMVGSASTKLKKCLLLSSNTSITSLTSLLQVALLSRSKRGMLFVGWKYFPTSLKLTTSLDAVTCTANSCELLACRGSAHKESGKSRPLRLERLVREEHEAL